MVVLMPVPMLKLSPYNPGCIDVAARTKAAHTSST